jgi:methionine sulfoxide reductase heme-binding subunit
MSEKYKAISWNRQKKLYDSTIFVGILLYLAVFFALGININPTATAETLIIRAFGTCAILLLHIVLIIGPLCRLSPKFLPLLYNRRHLGVTTFFIGTVHGIFSIIQFHAFGNVNPIISLLTSNTNFTSIPDFPFQILGFLALIILFLMTVTSHDFWLKNLTAPVWKTLHTLVYIAYGLLIAHVLLGFLQSEKSTILPVLLGFGVCVVVGLHLFAGFQEAKIDEKNSQNSDNFVDVCAVDEIPEKRACIATISGERVAIFKYAGKISAVSNVCQHQNGPLGEGEIIDGCITCPWHGFQYLPENGQSPPPFTEKIPTFKTKIENGRVFVHAIPEKAGSFVKPTEIL